MHKGSLVKQEASLAFRIKRVRAEFLSLSPKLIFQHTHSPSLSFSRT
jgi:hypothetical protein